MPKSTDKGEHIDAQTPPVWQSIDSQLEWPPVRGSRGQEDPYREAKVDYLSSSGSADRAGIGREHFVR